MSGIILQNISKSFVLKEETTNVLSNITINIPSGEIIALRGDNGTGKTTLLNIICGLVIPSQGSIEFTKTSPKIGFVQQDYNSSLLPWYNVLNNISLPLRLNGVNENIREEKVSGIISKLGFENLPLKKYPYQLSGGQKQRVAIARALIINPDILILDEPFSNIDAHTQIELQEVINEIQNEIKITIVFVSHELDHCLYLANKIYFLKGHPAEIIKEYKINLTRPRTRDQLISSGFSELRAQIIEEEYEFYTQK